MKVYIPKAVLFLHAFPLCSDMFSEQFKLLKENNIPYIALDYPGFGEEPPGRMKPDIENLTDYVVSKIDAFGVEKIVPVGVSMGGYIIFDMWKRYKDLIEGMVLVSTRAEADTQESRKARYELIEKIRIEGKEILINVMLENQTSPVTKENPKKMRKLRCMMERASEEGLVNTLKALAERPDNREILSSIDVPVLVIAGKDDDKITPPKVVKEIAEGIKGAEYKELENCAHLPPFENPKAFNKLLMSFLKRIF